MPRPTAAQYSYGSATVVFSALAMLLLFRTESGIGVAAVGTAAMVLGLLVAMALPARTRPVGERRRRPPPPARTARSRTSRSPPLSAGTSVSTRCAAEERPLTGR